MLTLSRKVDECKPLDLGEAKSLKKPPSGVDDITAVIIILLENNPKVRRCMLTLSNPS